MKRYKLTIRDFKCDVGKCKCMPFVEVYIFNEERHYWNYLCLPHFILSLIFKHENGWCLADWLLRLPLVGRLWNWWCK